MSLISPVTALNINESFVMHSITRLHSDPSSEVVKHCSIHIISSTFRGPLLMHHFSYLPNGTGVMSADIHAKIVKV